MKILIGLLIVNGCFGQSTGQNVVTVIVQPARNFTFPAITITGGTLQNIGQNSHTMIISASDFTGVGASWTVTSAGIQGSSDGTNWFFIGPQTNNTIISRATNAVVINGYGSYPYIRVIATIGGDVSTSFTGSIVYTGNSAPSYVLADALQSFMQMQNISLTTSIIYGTTFSVADAPTLTSSSVLYGLHMTMPATMTKFTLGCALNNSGVLISGTELLVVFNDTTTKDLVIPVGFRPFGSCKVGQRILGFAVGSGATAALNVVVRFE